MKIAPKSIIHRLEGQIEYLEQKKKESGLDNIKAKYEAAVQRRRDAIAYVQENINNKAIQYFKILRRFKLSLHYLEVEDGKTKRKEKHQDLANYGSIKAE